MVCYVTKIFIQVFAIAASDLLYMYILTLHSLEYVDQ